MADTLIRKAARGSLALPNLADYSATCASFNWGVERLALRGLPGGGINIAFEALDRHVQNGRGGQVALRCLSRDGVAREFTYAGLAAEANRFANVLAALGVGRGERVFSLLGRVPQLYVTALGALKAGAVFCPMFSAFGPEPIRARLELGGARVLVTTPQLYQRKVAALRDQLPQLQHVLLVGDAASAGSDTQSLATLMANADDSFDIPPTGGEDMALLHFTSGTTGRPKGAVHVHAAVLQHYVTGRLALDLHPGDVFWCTADPGWVTGTSYGIIAPLVIGATLVVDAEEFDAQRWYGILQEQKVDVWYTAPTAIRMLMRLGDELPARFDLSRLRFMASVGEPLNSEAVIWSQRALGQPFHDNWWQTETGGIMIANFAAMDIKPGSMGKPLPGIEAAIANVAKDGRLEFVDRPGEQGQLVLKAGWPSMFRGYLGEEERYRKCFVGDWYLSGDLARRDADGYYWFVGRADDVIKTSGHLIGPFEVEDVLMQHPAVAECGVIGKPDPVAGEIIKAFVALKPGFEPDAALHDALLAHARKRLGAVVAPKEIEFAPSLPKTRSGKIMRRLLKARELGLPEGDTSTLENA
ncbi:acetate--CoA ligase [Immundisolibacter sp.]|uniref:acetate--CoA ligase n=1 Tax=Immundisolibacter sp. TaxID=1934948 RepID=UPI002B0FBD36|nr:acetate--CoA ligase [Immundisolibacter sp.]MEA3221112.1 Acetyl-coenzyme A synthetase [Immundisolibacter sp.]